MAETQFDMCSVPREMASQPVFHNGMVSPSPLDDMMFAPQSDFHFGGGDDLSAGLSEESMSRGLMMKDVIANGAPSESGVQTFASSKRCPPTPSSLSQPSTFVLDEPQENSELSSILDRPKKTQGRSAETRTAASGDENRAKKQRRQSSGSVSSSSKPERMEGKDRSREKNKIAAAKCRAKKRDNMEVIESNHRTLSTENSLLRRQEQQLRATVAELRTLALDHQSCNCGVHQYNMLEARKLAHGLGGLCSMGFHSNNAASVERRRKHADPAGIVSPNTAAAAHSRSHSFAAPGQFGLSSADEFLLQHPVFGGEQSFFEYDPSLNDSKLDA